MDAATGISYQESQLEKEAYTGLNGAVESGLLHSKLHFARQKLHFTY